MSVLWNSNGKFAEEIPSGYAPLAGLPLQYGLYASIVPGFTYCLLGTTRWTFSERICAKLFSFAGKQPSVQLRSTRSCRSTTPAALLIRSIHKKNCQQKLLQRRSLSLSSLGSSRSCVASSTSASSSSTSVNQLWRLSPQQSAFRCEGSCKAERLEHMLRAGDHFSSQRSSRNHRHRRAGLCQCVGEF